MAIKVSQAFERTSAAPIDTTITLTKAQMKTVNDNMMPPYYFTICQDDGKIYLYNKNTAAPSAITGKFEELETGGGDKTPFLLFSDSPLSLTIDGNMIIDYADMELTDGSSTPPTTADLVLGKSLVYDADGTVGLITNIDNINSNVTVTTMTTAYLRDLTYIAPAYDPTATYEEGDVVTFDNKRYVANTDIDPAEDPFDPTHWTEQDVQTAIDSMGGGDSTAKYNYTTNIEVGGIPVGTQIQSTDLLADIIKNMLVTTYYPTYVAPSATLTYSASTYAEVGSTITARNGVVAYDAGAINLQGTKQADRAGGPTQYALATSGADTEYSDTSASSGTFNVPALTRSTKGNIVLTATVNYAQGPQPLDSNGDPYQTPLPAGSVTATKTIQFIQAFFYGASASSTVSTLAGLTKDVTAKGQKKYKYTTNNEHMVIAYDSSYGNLTSILDPNSFETISGWTKSTLTYNGFTYNVYVADAATTDTNAEFTFKF